MPVVIIEEAEELSKVIDGATFYYRRIPGPTRDRIYTACTSKRTGVLDAGKHLRMMLVAGLTGWKDVIDKRGNQIPFSPDIAPYLPDTVQGDLVDAFGANIEKMQESELPNSGPTPSSST